MALRSVVIEGTPLKKGGELRWFELPDAPTTGHAFREGLIAHVPSYYGHELADAAVYEPVLGRSFEGLRDFLSPGKPIHVYPLTRRDLAQAVAMQR